MKLTTKTLWTTLAAVIVGAVAIVSVSAQGPGFGQGPGQRGMGPGGPGHGPGPMAMLRQLDLTDAQRTQIRAIMDESRPAEGQMKTMGDLQKQLHDAIFADTPDEAKIEQLKAAIGEAETAVLAHRISVEMKIAQVLTPEQRAKARELADQRPQRGRGPGGFRQ